MQREQNADPNGQKLTMQGLFHKMKISNWVDKDQVVPELQLWGEGQVGSLTTWLREKLDVTEISLLYKEVESLYWSHLVAQKSYR